MSARKTFALSAAAIILTACATAQENPQYQYSTKYKGDSPYATTQGATQGTTYASNTLPAQTQNVVFQQQPVETSYHSQAAYSATSYATTAQAGPSYSRVNAACIQQNAQHTPGCEPSSVAITQTTAQVAAPYAPQPQTLYATDRTEIAIVSPTEQAMPDSYGTPGYEAMKNAESGWSYEPAMTPEWEVTQSTRPAPAPSTIAPSSTALLGQSVPVTEPFESALPAPSARHAEIYSARSPVMMPRVEQSFTLGTQREVIAGDTVYSFARKLCSSIDEIKAMNSLGADFNIRLGDTIRLPASKC